MIKRVSI